jgi:hypothetical protein
MAPHRPRRSRTTHQQGRPSDVTEPPGTQITTDPSRLAIFKDYVRNIAAWLDAAIVFDNPAARTKL